MEANDIPWSDWFFLNAWSGHHAKGWASAQEYELTDEELSAVEARKRRPFGFCVESDER